MDAETVISIFFGAVLAVFSFAVVGYAFVRGRQPESESSAGAAISLTDGIVLLHFLGSHSSCG